MLATLAHAARTVRAWATLAHLSLIAVVAITAHAHWYLATTLGLPAWLAPFLPVAVDAYVLAAFRAWEVQTAAVEAGRKVKVRRDDLVFALGIDGAAVAGSHAASQLPLTEQQKAVAAAALGVILVLTLWRVHALDAGVRATTKGLAQAAPKPKPSPTVGTATAAPAGLVSPPSPAPAVPARKAVPTAPVSPPDRDGPVDGIDRPHGRTLDEWVRDHFQSGTARRADVIRYGAEWYDVAGKTVARRWDALARAARGDAEPAEDPAPADESPAPLRAVQ